MGWGERQLWRGEGGEWLACHLTPRWYPGLDYCQGPILVRGPEAADDAWVDVCNFCCHWGPCRGLWSGPTPGARLVSEGHDAAGARPIRVSDIATLDQGDIQAQAAAEHHIWIHDPPTASICIDIHSALATKGHTLHLGCGPHLGSKIELIQSLVT